jgi:hypothetical protein
MTAPDPWRADGDRPPRQLGWGCLAAVIIGSVTALVALVLVLRVVASTYPW